VKGIAQTGQPSEGKSEKIWELLTGGGQLSTDAEMNLGSLMDIMRSRGCIPFINDDNSGELGAIQGGPLSSQTQTKA
jgi:hypothetical protein